MAHVSPNPRTKPQKPKHTKADAHGGAFLFVVVVIVLLHGLMEKSCEVRV